jgi:PAS domain S-box-containing protein
MSLAKPELSRFIHDASVQGICTLSADGRLTAWNAGARRLYGYAEDEVLGQPLALLFGAEEQRRERPATALGAAAHEGTFEEELWLTRKDGSTFWAAIALEAIRDSDARLLGYTLITRDITGGRHTQQALHSSEEQFRLLVQSVTDYAIYMLSPEGLVTNWNEGARRIKGYDEEEVIGTHFSRFYTDEDRREGIPMWALATARSAGRCEREGWRVRKDGSRFWAHVVIDPIYDPQGELVGFAKITRDVTERREAEESLARAREALMHAQKLEAMGKLTGGIAHDFNNLLNVIMNGLDLLRLGGDRTVQTRAIESMERAANRGANLTQQLLAFARQQPLKPEQLNLSRLLPTFEAVLRRAIPSSMVLDVRVGSGLPDIVADATQLEAAVLNLVVNARDALMGRDGRIEVSAELERQPPADSQLAHGAYVCLRVRDNGCGMTPEVAARAIEPFFTTKEVGKGTGLGLSQVYGVMQEAKGDLRIASQPGQGTEIALYFPALAQAVKEGAPSGQPAAKVLVVDDQPELLDITLHLFKSLGYDVLPANNGREALAVLQRQPDIAILFSDVVMPELNGIDLAKQARVIRPNLYVLLASGYMNTALKEQHRDLDDFEFINKPYRLAELIKKLKAAHQQTGTAAVD